MKPALARLCLLVLLLLSARLVPAQTVFPTDDWQVATPESQSMSADKVAQVGEWLKANGSKTGLVVRHGRIVGEWYFDEAKPDSKYIVYSTTKSFSSTAAGLAVAAGKLKLDSKLGDYFPAAMPESKRDITVRQLLSMTSGAHSDNAQLNRSDLLPYILNDMPMDAAPGTKWEYNNTGLQLLSPIIKEATGQTIPELLDEGVFKKIGIKGEDWSWEERSGVPLVYSGLHITARSLARYGLLFLNGGMWNKNKVISADWVAEATRASQELNPRYGYLWWNNSNGAWPSVPKDAYAAMGKFSNDMLVVPSLDLIVIRQVGDDSGANRQIKIDELFALATGAVNDVSPTSETPETPIDVEVEKAFTKFRVERPILVTHAGDGSNRLFVPSQLGKIFVLPNDSEVEEPSEFLDISERVVYVDRENEKGFLGMAFHPKYKENGEFFVYYTPTDTKPNTIAVSRFRVSQDDPNKADPKSEERLIEVQHPFWNHKGGTLAFGPDGYLYIAIGDGGLRDDPFKNGQNLKTHLAKILRIDVNHKDAGKNYAIPKDNPFVGQGDKALPEIYAYGLRNPWRIAFDKQTGMLWCADVGQDLWEEIDLIRKGGNYGWNIREGVHKFGPNGSDPRPELIEPIWEYHHSIGKSITGGHVYRGKKLPQLDGCYIFADYVSGKVWALKYDEAQKKVAALYTISGNVSPIMSFGEDEQGETYYTTDGGLIYGLRQIPK
jgi:CubicO group peptidase (beta-lactamase class C family)